MAFQKYLHLQKQQKPEDYKKLEVFLLYKNVLNGGGIIWRNISWEIIAPYLSHFAFPFSIPVNLFPHPPHTHNIINAYEKA